MKNQDPELFAHSTKNTSRLDWEFLETHLSGVGDHGKTNADGFGAARWESVRSSVYE